MLGARGTKAARADGRPRPSRRPRWLLATLLVVGTLVVGACGGACEGASEPSERPGAPDPPTQFDPELEPAETPDDFDPFDE